MSGKRGRAGKVQPRPLAFTSVSQGLSQSKLTAFMSTPKTGHASSSSSSSGAGSQSGAKTFPRVHQPPGSGSGLPKHLAGAASSPASASPATSLGKKLFVPARSPSPAPQPATLPTRDPASVVKLHHAPRRRRRIVQADSSDDASEIEDFSSEEESKDVGLQEKAKRARTSNASSTSARKLPNASLANSSQRSVSGGKASAATARAPPPHVRSPEEVIELLDNSEEEDAIEGAGGWVSAPNAMSEPHGSKYAPDAARAPRRESFEAAAGGDAKALGAGSGGADVDSHIPRGSVPSGARPPPTALLSSAVDSHVPRGSVPLGVQPPGASQLAGGAGRGGASGSLDGGEGSEMTT